MLYNMNRKGTLKLKGGHAMSTREYATELVNALSEEQVNTLVSFIKSFADRATIARIESVQLANDPNPKTYNSFREFMNEAETADDE